MTEIIERYVRLTEQRRRLDAWLDRVKDQLTALEDAVLEEMIEGGCQSVKAAGGRTVYLHRQFWANPVEGDYQRASAALRAAGLSDMVLLRFDTKNLSAWCRERNAAGEPLPSSFDGAIKVSEQVSVRVRGR